MDNWITPGLVLIYGIGMLLALAVLAPIAAFFGYIVYLIFTM